VSTTVVQASAAHLRIEHAARWLADRDPAQEVLIIAANSDAASDLVRRATIERRAAFGWHRSTLGRVAAELAMRSIVDDQLASVGRLASEAIVARAVHSQAAGEATGLGRFDAISGGPGFARAVAMSLAELRLAGVEPEVLAKVAPELRAILDAYQRELVAQRLVDRSDIFSRAVHVARDRNARHPWLDLPTLLLDVPVENPCERDLVSAIAARSGDLVVTAPCGEPDPREFLAPNHSNRDQQLIDLDREAIALGSGASTLRRLQTHLFEEASPPEANLDSQVRILSAPGEGRESIEIARRVLGFSEQGVAFDQMAVLLRSPHDYRPHLAEALARAGIPAHFAKGVVRPDPAGRAFLALLSCAAEELSARRFSEYLSLGEVPELTPDGSPPPAPAATDRWVAPDEELVPEAIANALGASHPAMDALAGAEFGIGRRPEESHPTADRVIAGSLRAPRRWERLLVDAAVIGGRDRWERRLGGLESELCMHRDEQEDAEGPRAQRIQADLESLGVLREFALPLLDVLEALPTSAPWGEWLDQLGALATRALRHPDRVLAVMSELAPMASIGPVTLPEVQRVLSNRLTEVSLPPAKNRYGRVFVAPIEAARGMSFEVVFVPGLAERMFPQKIREDPMLLDIARERLADAGFALRTNSDRIGEERRALRLAVGAAKQSLVLSYPRLDLDQSRPRVPSFYALEVLRAAEGRLPGFSELAQRAESTSDARVGWPAPADPFDAIDEAEHDLALLDSLMRLEPEKSVGTARFLMTTNPHLGRALRFRARRWLQGWTVADGLVKPSQGARDAMAAHALSARSYSPTALQHYASCPYKFFLQAIHRLQPRDVPVAIEELNPLQRGSLVHEVQFELFGKLRDESLLPIDAENLAAARAVLDEILDRVASRYRDELAPAIDRVWDDGVDHVRADLREWLRRAAEDESGFVPWRFEFSFGLPGRRDRDPHSTPDPIELDCGIRLRGSIDLVERDASDRLRVTDHKTGRVRATKTAIVGGGESLQAVLYALVAERAFPDTTVTSGELYYCTATGGFEQRGVALDRRARDSAEQVAATIGAALTEPFLPAAPKKGACRFCDYRVVCGPYEELRTARKWAPPLEALTNVRDLP
jgi:ATP-dependent helicase/nuclease subunit B